MEQEQDNKDINKNDLIKGTNWWKPVFIFYVKTTSWIVFPLFLGVLIGGYVGSSMKNQIMFCLFILFGFFVTCFGIYREIKTYKKSLNITSQKPVLRADMVTGEKEKNDGK